MLNSMKWISFNNTLITIALTCFIRFDSMNIVTNLGTVFGIFIGLVLTIIMVVACKLLAKRFLL